MEAPVPDPVELMIDVTSEADIGESTSTAATVHLPAATRSPARPSSASPSPAVGTPAAITLSTCGAPARPGTPTGAPPGSRPRPLPRTRTRSARPDGTRPGAGSSSHATPLASAIRPHPAGDVLTYENIALGNKATVAAVMAKLESGTLLDGYPPVPGATTLGLGQSMGGCFTIVIQGQHQIFDGIAALGYSAIHTVVPSRPGTPPIRWPWILRGSDLASPKVLNQAALAATASPALPDRDSPAATPRHGRAPLYLGVPLGHRASRHRRDRHGRRRGDL